MMLQGTDFERLDRVGRLQAGMAGNSSAARSRRRARVACKSRPAALAEAPGIRNLVVIVPGPFDRFVRNWKLRPGFPAIMSCILTCTLGGERKCARP